MENKMKLLKLCCILLLQNYQNVNSAPIVLSPSFGVVSTSAVARNPTSTTKSSTEQIAMTIKPNKNVTKLSPGASYVPPASTQIAVTDSPVLLKTVPTATITTKNSSLTSTERKKHIYHYYFVAAIGILSVLSLAVNFVLMTKVCSSDDITVMNLFGISLVLFNILLSLYGIALAAYLSQESWSWHKRFCQGITSIKLFALGSGVWTLIMLTFQHSISGSTEHRDTTNEHKLRDAKFKGIVFVLEGVMLSGVFAVMSWIKLDTWCYLCSILSPHTTVDWLLSGIEMWYYVLSLLLLIRYPLYLWKIDPETKVKRRINQEHPIFILILLSFMIWATGYIVTIPLLNLFTYEVSAVIRVCVLMCVTIVQPFIFAIRNMCCCTWQKKNKNKKSSVEDVLLVCECSGSETCHACESEFSPRTKYDDTKFTEANRKENKINDKKGNRKKVEKTHEIIKKNKKRKSKGKVASPTVASRSPEIIRDTLKNRSTSSAAAEKDSDMEGENRPLLNDTKENGKEKPDIPNAKIKKLSSENIPLLDDMDGRPTPPKALPELSPFKGVHGSSINSPSRNRQKEFPSFINLKNAVNVDELPKEQKITVGLAPDKFKEKPLDAEGRVSRGPTFYQIAEKVEGEKKNQDKEESIPEEITDIKINNAKVIETETIADEQKRKLESELKTRDKTRDKNKKNVKKNSKKEKKSKKNAKKKNSAGIESVESLEWDHTYSCSDSSNPGSVRDSLEHEPKQSHPSDEKVIASVTATSHHDHAMEWDPSGCTMKDSPDLRHKQSTDNNTCPDMAGESRSSSAVNTLPTGHLSSEVSSEDQSGVNDEKNQQTNGFKKSSENISQRKGMSEELLKEKNEKSDKKSRDKKKDKKSKKEEKKNEKKLKDEKEKKEKKTKEKSINGTANKTQKKTSNENNGDAVVS